MSNFEHYLVSSGIVILKFFLNVSKEEQRQRFQARIDEPEKNWKFSMADCANGNSGVTTRTLTRKCSNIPASPGRRGL